MTLPPTTRAPRRATLPLRVVVPAGFALALAVLVAVSWLAMQRIDAMHAATRWVERTHQTMEALARTAARAAGAESAARGYVLYRTSAYRALHRREAAAARAAVAEVRALLAGQPATLAQADTLRAIVDLRLDALAAFVATFEAEGTAAALALAQAQHAAVLSARLTRRVDEITRAQRTLLAARSAHEAIQVQRLRAVFALAVLGTVLVTLAALALVARDARRRAFAERERDRHAAETRRLALALEAQNEDLLNQAEELEAQNRALLEQAGELARQADALAERTHELRRTHGILDAVLEHMADGVVAVDADGTLTVCNLAAAHLLGLPLPAPPVAEWVRHHVVRAADGERALASAELPLARALDGERLDGEEVVVVTARSGEARTLAVNGRPLQGRVGRAGGAAGAMLTLHDVTARKQIERVKNELVSVVSHELRTPLTSIRGALGLLASGAYGELPPRAASLVELGRANTDRLARLVDDLLDLEKLEAGRVELRADALTVQALAGDALGEMRGMAEQRGVRLAADVAAELVVTGDRDRLVQVLTNLVSNAIKFSPTGSTVQVSAEPGPAGGALVCVRDEGPGIADGDVARLFTKFGQLDASDARRHGGTGLGLAISRNIVERHGGTIGVRSRPGTGAEFWFTLPGASASADAAPTHAPGPRRAA